MKSIYAFALTVLISTAAIATEAPKTNDPKELKKIITAQQKEIDSLKKEQLVNAEPASGGEAANKDAFSNPLLKNKMEYLKR